LIRAAGVGGWVAARVGPIATISSTAFLFESDCDHAVGAINSVNGRDPARLTLKPSYAVLLRASNYKHAMVQRRLTNDEMHRLGPCLTALRILAHSKGPRRDILIEKNIDEYLRTDPFSLAHALERLRRAIHYEELEKREREDWSVAKNYVRLLLHRMSS
jgi:hypothetical protein